VVSLKALALKLRGIFGKDVKTGFEQFEFDTGGTGELVNAPPVVPAPYAHEFVEGWWLGAKRFDIHPRRLGGAIHPWSTVVHTTDMIPGTMAPLLKRWRDVPGEGAGAHFLIGKQAAGESDAVPTGGVVQMAPITRNGNHAGGPDQRHGWFKLVGGRLIHPNSVSVGIELDNAGRLVKRSSDWVHKDTGRVVRDVFVDTHGRGYERVTAYQFAMLDALLDALDNALPASPLGATVVPNGSYKDNGVPEASLPWVREVGHWTLDPTRKTDPGPQVDAFLESRAAR